MKSVLVNGASRGIGAEIEELPLEDPTAETTAKAN